MSICHYIMLCLMILIQIQTLMAGEVRFNAVFLMKNVLELFINYRYLDDM